MNTFVYLFNGRAKVSLNGVLRICQQGSNTYTAMQLTRQKPYLKTNNAYAEVALNRYRVFDIRKMTAG
jgi:predicted DCC family thiol-disulfide oxidoreductase YuxK